MNKIALIGYSGHAYVVSEVLKQMGYEVFGYFEREPIKKNVLDIRYLGYEEDDEFIHQLKSYLLFPAIGNNIIRRRIILQIFTKNGTLVTAISPFAHVSTHATVGLASLVCQGACINPFANIGIGTIINTAAVVEHECIVSNFAHIAPGAVLTGNVTVGENSFVGANAVIKQGIIIGDNVTIGAGAVVLCDVPNDETWIGNPAKRMVK